MNESSFITEPIAEGDPLTGFRCGVQALDEFFAKHAVQNDRRGLGKTFVLRSSTGDPPILGFYALSMADVEVTNLPDKLRRGLPQYPVPVARIGRFATDERVRGHGHGADLLQDAFMRILAAAATVGCYGVLVDAKDERASAFYSHYGFIALDRTRSPTPMLLTMKVLRKAMSDADLAPGSEEEEDEV